MNAMVLKEFNAALVIDTAAEIPEIGPDEVLIKVKACGICRTDLKIQKGLFDNRIIHLQHIMGHEFAGTVERAGSRVRGMAVGRRVVAHFYISCGKCRFCKEGRENLCSHITRPGFELAGAYAQYVKVPADNVVPLGDRISFEEAAVLPDAVATPYHALRMGELKPGESVLVVGLGGLGIHAIQIAKALGGRVIACDIDEARLKVAAGYGADEVFNARDDARVEKVQDLTDGDGVDVCLDLVGTPASFAWALPSTRKGGRYLLVGYAPNQPLQIDTVLYHVCEWRLLGCRASTRQDLVEVVELTEKGLIKPVIDRVYALERANEGLKDLAEGKILGRGVLRM